MTDLMHPDVQTLLTEPNTAVISTHNPDGSISSTIVWIEGGEETVSVNSAVGRKWPTNLDNNPHVTVVVASSPWVFVEIRGTAQSTLEGADAQIDRLAKKYLGEDTYPFRTPTEQRISYTITPTHVRYLKQA